MRPKYDAFGRPVEPEPPRSGTLGRPGDRSSRDPRSAEHRSSGSPSAPWTPATRRDDAVVPEVRGLPAMTGGGPVGAPAGKRIQGLMSAAGAIGAVLLVLLAVVGSLADDDPPSAGPGASTGAGRVTALSTDRAERAAGLLRAAMDPGDRVLSASIAAGYASARVVSADGTETRSLSLEPDGRVTSVGGTATDATSRGVPAGDFDAGVPRAVLEAVRRGLGPAATGTVRSLSASSFRGEPLRWSAAVEGGPEVARSWTADAAGRSVVRTRDGAPAPPEGEPGPATVPVGIAGGSLLVPANLRAALARLGSLPALQDRTPRQIGLESLNLRPERLLAGVRDGAVRRLVSVDAALGLDPSAVTRMPGRDAVALPDVDAAGPARALRTIGRRLSADAAARVRSILLTDVGGPSEGARPGWLVLLDGEGDDRVWRASIDGRLVGRSGEDLTP